jgi:hypothetical protein
MRWLVLVVLTVVALHQIAMSAMLNGMAVTRPMAQATIAHPQSCSAPGVQQDQGPCTESCSILQATTISRSPVTSPSPTSSAGHSVGSSRSARLPSGAGMSGLPVAAGCRPPSVLQVLRI